MKPKPSSFLIERSKVDSPVLSVVVPVFNGAQYLGLCLACLDRLAIEIPIEVIIQDACSSDGTSAIVEAALSGRQNWYHVVEKDRGQSDAINRGVARARGDWVTWLCADDILLPGFASAFAEGRASGADIIYGDVVFVTNEDGAFPATGTETHTPGLLARSRLVIQQPGTAIRRARWLAAGGVNLRHNWAMDYDLFLRLEAQGTHFHRARIFVAAALLHPDAKTSSASFRRLTEMWGILAAAHRRRPKDFRLRPYLVYGLEYAIKRLEAKYNGAKSSNRLRSMHKRFWKLAQPKEAAEIEARYMQKREEIETIAEQLRITP